MAHLESVCVDLLDWAALSLTMCLPVVAPTLGQTLPKGRHARLYLPEQRMSGLKAIWQSRRQAKLSIP